MRPIRFPWRLLIGLLAGLALGLVYAWVVSPVEYIDTNPASLRTDFKDQYRLVIARAYLATGDLSRAEARLALLGDADPVEALSAQAQRNLASGDNPDSVRALAQLALDLQGQLAAQPTATATPELPNQPSTPTIDAGAAIQTATASPEPTATGTFAAPLTPTRTRRPTRTPTPLNTLTPRPTLTATATLGAPFVIADQRQVCDPNLPDGLLSVTVLNAAGKPVAGMGIIVSWAGGEETFFTGFKPEVGEGYADFVMQPGVVYSLRLTVPSASAAGIQSAPCRTDQGVPYQGSVEVIFRQQ